MSPEEGKVENEITFFILGKMKVKLRLKSDGTIKYMNEILPNDDST